MRRAPWAATPLVALAWALGGCGDLSLNLVVPADASLPSNGDGGPSAPPVVHCSVASQCAEAGAPFCDVDAGTCVACLSSNDCSGSTPHCLRGTCVSCTADADCSTGMVCNMHIPRCATQCTSGTECNGRPCAPEYGYCVECMLDGDCTTPGLPFCFQPPAYGICVGCRSNSDCDGATCGPSQRCEAH